MTRPLAIITGGTSGIGLGIALKLAPTHDLALIYASDTGKAEEAVRDIKNNFPDSQAQAFQQKLSSAADCEKVLGLIRAEFSKDAAVLINSAGRLNDELFLGSDFNGHLTLIQEHLIVTMAMSQLCLKAMYKNRFGRIINLSSISANFAKSGQTSYAAAKSGIEGFTKTLAIEVAHRGVTINAIAPGLIETPMTKKFVEDLEAKGVSLRKRIPAARMGKPEEVGALAAFLCSAEASYITGVVIKIDGGRSLGDTGVS